ncbi:MAG: PEP-CTERM sorting domain-containing protein [Terriglobales bacterium]
MKIRLHLLATGVAAVLSLSARADTLTFTPSPPDLADLDEAQVYTWRLSNINLSGMTITGARLTFTNIAVGTPLDNRLYLHLLDTARSAGVASFSDQPASSSGLLDDFVDPRYHSQSGWLVPTGTADTFLTAPDVPMTPSILLFNFSAAQVQALSTYIANGGNFALGFDPDSTTAPENFFNDGVKFEIFTMPIPEPGTMALLVFGAVALIAAGKRARPI